MLPAVRGQRLPEVTGAVVQTDRDQRQPEIRCGFQVIAGQDSQSARVIRQHLRDAELHREVRDAVGHPGAVGLLLLVPLRTGQIVVEVRGQPVQPVQKPAVDGQLVESGRADRAQQGDRILPTLHPQRRVDRRKEILGRFVPRPSQVGRQLLQRRQAFRKVGTDREPTEGFHTSPLYGREGTFRVANDARDPTRGVARHYGGYWAQRVAKQSRPKTRR